jgi:peptidylprolyl isomerase
VRRLAAPLVLAALALTAASCKKTQAPPAPDAKSSPTTTAAPDKPCDPPAPAKNDPPADGPQCKTEVVTKGEGRGVKSGDIVLAHFSVALASGGAPLADTRKDGDPQALPLGSGRLLPALEQTLPKMCQGDRWKVTAPYQLAFGDRSIPGLPARSDVVFDVEVVGFVDMKTEVIASGQGEVPARGDVVCIHYTGTLTDGTKFDSSRDRGEPLSFPVGVGQVIPGWDLTVLKMKPGDHWKVTVPWQLAYGAPGKPPMIPAKADLVFDMERMPAPEIKTEVVKKGEGPQCARGQTVKVHYVGTLTDGTKFDSSRDRNEPFDVILGAGQVIPGWEMTLAKMHVGDRWKVTIPWQFAYGPAGQPPTIPGKADLVFDIEVLEAK